MDVEVVPTSHLESLTLHTPFAAKGTDTLKIAKNIELLTLDARFAAEGCTGTLLVVPASAQQRKEKKT